MTEDKSKMETQLELGDADLLLTNETWSVSEEQSREEIESEINWGQLDFRKLAPSQKSRIDFMEVKQDSILMDQESEEEEKNDPNFDKEL